MDKIRKSSSQSDNKLIKLNNNFSSVNNKKTKSLSKEKCLINQLNINKTQFKFSREKVNKRKFDSNDKSKIEDSKNSEKSDNLNLINLNNLIIEKIEEDFDENETEKKKFIRRVLRINTSKCRSELRLIKLIIQKRGWKEVFDSNADIFWSGLNFASDEFISIRGLKVNRIPYLVDLAEKRFTAFFLNKFQYYFPENFDFYPRTFLLPEDFGLLKAFKKANKKKLLIAKPTSGSQGDGILLLKKVRDVENLLNNTFNNTKYVVQEYIDNPLLINKKKFDVRLYILISSIEPLRVWIHDEGLARFCTEDYEKPTISNLKNVYMHLSNYSLNKNNKNYVYSEECVNLSEGTKRTMESLWKNFEIEGILDKKEAVFQDIENLIKKFVISMYPFICYYCKVQFGKNQNLSELKNFHIMGFDIMIDQNFKAWLLEINANPSLSIEHDPNYVKLIEISPIDFYVKEKVIEDCLDIMNFKKSEVENFEEGNKYEGYKLLMNGSSEMEDMDIFIKILKAFEKISGGFRFNGLITSTKFIKLSNLNIKSTSCQKLERIDYDIIYRNIVKYGKGMDFYDFIYSIEILCNKYFFSKKDDEDNFIDPKEKLINVNLLVDAILAL